jgi:hypothetical protein
MLAGPLQAEFFKVLAKTTAKEFVFYIQELEQIDDYKSSKILLLIKTVAFRSMLRELNIPEYALQRVRGGKTELHLDEEFKQHFLLISKKDKENYHLVYPELFSAQRRTFTND